jgi:threonine synthase
MWKAFDELETLGLIGAKRPRMVAVQAEGCAPIIRAWESGAAKAERWQDARTAAAGIRVPKTIGDSLILDAVRESGGFAISVSEEQIGHALLDAAREDGMLLCPEGAATLAAWRRSLAQGRIATGDRAVVFNCASGLKYELPAIS